MSEREWGNSEIEWGVGERESGECGVREIDVREIVG